MGMETSSLERCEEEVSTRRRTDKGEKKKDENEKDTRKLIK